MTASYIPVSQGKYSAVVDSDLFDFLSQWNWRLISGYASRSQKYRDENGKMKKKTIRMHSVINQTPQGMVTDHINGDKLDNRKSNLRSATRQQNQWNRKPGKMSFTGIKGVGWCIKTNKWRTSISIDGSRKTIGYYECIGMAIKRYNDFAKEYHGDFARLNKRSA